MSTTGRTRVVMAPTWSLVRGLCHCRKMVTFAIAAASALSLIPCEVSANAIPEHLAAAATAKSPLPLIPHYAEPRHQPHYYQFGYQVKDAYTDDYHGHMEFSKGDKTLGEFKVQLPDGRVQVTSYEADDHGYRPTISYEYPTAAVAKRYKDPPDSHPAAAGHHGAGGPGEELYLVAVEGGRYVVLAKKKRH